MGLIHIQKTGKTNNNQVSSPKPIRLQFKHGIEWSEKSDLESLSTGQ